MYLVFTRMPGESCPRHLMSLLLCLCDVFQALVNSPVDHTQGVFFVDGKVVTSCCLSNLI